MQSSGWGRFWPSFWRRESLPEVDDARPACCNGCGKPAKESGKVHLHGHGCRVRSVVVLAAVFGEEVQVMGCWVRRYRCCRCGAVLTVLPMGVLSRYLYSVAAIVVALLLKTEAPVGEGLGDAEVYRRQGMYRRPSWWPGGGYRWRSLERWARLCAQWWPGRAVSSIEAVLVDFVSRARSPALEDVVLAALSGHRQWEAAM